MNQGYSCIRWSLFVFVVLAVLATTSRASESCYPAQNVGLNANEIVDVPSWSSRECFVSDVESPGWFSLEVSTQANYGGPVHLKIYDGACDLAPIDYIVEHVAGALVRVDGPTPLAYCVVSDAPEQPLGRVRVATRFARQVDLVGDRDEDEPDPDPLSANDNRDEDEPDPDPLSANDDRDEDEPDPDPLSANDDRDEDEPDPDPFGADLRSTFCDRVKFDDHADSLFCATTLASNVGAVGRLDGANDIDTFVFSMTELALARVSIEGPVTARLFDRGGLLLERLSGAGQIATLSRALPVGTYYVRVESEESTDYRIRIVSEQ